MDLKSALILRSSSDHNFNILRCSSIFIRNLFETRNYSCKICAETVAYPSSCKEPILVKNTRRVAEPSFYKGFIKILGFVCDWLINHAEHPICSLIWIQTITRKLEIVREQHRKIFLFCHHARFMIINCSCAAILGTNSQWIGIGQIRLPRESRT